MSTLRYDDTYAVELYDRVNLDLDDWVHEGQVTRIYPRAGEVQVRYADELDVTRKGDPRIKSTRVPIEQIALIARDG